MTAVSPLFRYLLAYLELSPQHCLVVEGPQLYFQPTEESSSAMTLNGDGEGGERNIVGFACAAPEVSAWARDREELCRSHLRGKYPKRDSLKQPDIERLLLNKPGSSGSLCLSVNEFISVSFFAFFQLGGF